MFTPEVMTNHLREVKVGARVGSGPDYHVHTLAATTSFGRRSH
jgi:hypothetical protein